MRVGALDLGSNSFHLIVADVHPDGHFEPIVREKEMLRLGDVVSRHGVIPRAAADVVVATVRRFRRLAEAAGATEIQACGTAAFRRAANSAEVVDRIEADAGVAVDVISGRREAELIFGAVRSAVVLEPAPALCVDLGGGSVELMVGDAGGLRYATSENLGVAQLTAEFVTSDPISKRDRRRLRAHIDDALARVRAEVAPMAPALLVGSSGTFVDIARMVAARRHTEPPRSVNQLTFSRDEFASVHDDVLTAEASSRLRFAGLETRRVDLIPAGVIFLASLMDTFGFASMTISEWALREGMVLDAIRRHDPADWSDDPRAIRRASVQGLARRCTWPEAHSRHVARLARSLFDQTAGLHGLGVRDRELLEYGALLHDIGEHVASQGHHRHGAYLIEHGQLRGFDPAEVQLLAALARWHRRGLPEPGAEFPLVDPGRLRKLAALLRIADGLDRGRAGVVTGLSAHVGPSLVLLRLETRDDSELEEWGARRKRELFEKVFGRDLELVHQHHRARKAGVVGG